MAQVVESLTNMCKALGLSLKTKINKERKKEKKKKKSYLTPKISSITCCIS
jgi:hypothetical protein